MQARHIETISHHLIETAANEVTWSDDDAGYALPPGSLDFLVACILRFGIKRVFEFGSGASTHRFLEAGCEVTTLENDAHWLKQTLAQIPIPLRSRLHLECRPLRRVWDAGYPCMGWTPTGLVLQRLVEADLVLIDSPAYPPFREAALLQTMRLSNARMVVLDDVRIPTLRRFCDRIAMQSQGIKLTCIERDHTLAVFTRGSSSTLSNRSTLIELAKGWRRYLIERG